MGKDLLELTASELRLEQAPASTGLMPCAGDGRRRSDIAWGRPEVNKDGYLQEEHTFLREDG